MDTFVLLISLCITFCYVSGNSTGDFPLKSILRYGFQNTQGCLDYEKAFICIRKCQDLNYDSAISDKNCKCTCYTKPELAKHKIKSNTTRDDWKSGAPTTKLPIWAQTTNTDMNYLPDEDDDQTIDEKDISEVDTTVAHDDTTSFYDTTDETDSAINNTNATNGDKDTKNATVNSTEDLEEDITTDSAGDTTSDSAGDTTPDSAGDTTPDSAGDTTPDFAGDTTSDFAGDTTSDFAGDTTTDFAGDTTDPAGNPPDSSDAPNTE